MNRKILATIAAAACTAALGLGCDRNSSDTNPPAQSPGNTNMQPSQYSADPGTQSAVGPNYVDASAGVAPGDTNGASGGLAGARTGNYDQTSTGDAYGRDSGSRAMDIDRERDLNATDRDYTNEGVTGNSPAGGVRGGHDGGTNVSPLSPPAGYSHRR